MKMFTQPIKWYGGKHYLADWIISLMPPHLHYVEPFFGGGSVLLRKPVELVDGHSEVVNDIDGELTTFWRVLQGEETFARFARIIDAMPFSQVEFDAAREHPSDHSDDVDRAVAFFVRARQSREGKLTDFATVTRNRLRRRMNEQVSAWLTAVEGLPAVHQRLRRVLILSGDAVRVIGQQDGPQTLFYLDPPYMHQTRVSTGDYRHEMTEAGHMALLDALATIQGKFLLSGYRSSLYSSCAQRHGWRCEVNRIDIKASAAKQKDTRTECVWRNF